MGLETRLKTGGVRKKKRKKGKSEGVVLEEPAPRVAGGVNSVILGIGCRDPNR